MEALLIVAAALGLYFLPTIVGWNKRNAGAIFALNFFLGWTLIGWVVAIVWAMTYDPIDPRLPPTYEKPRQQTSSVDQIMKLTTLRDSGALTEAEYQKEKGKILNS